MIRFLREALNRFRSFFRKEPLDQELDVAMASHIEMAIEENVRRGLPLEEARQACTDPIRRKYRRRANGTASRAGFRGLMS